MVPNGYVSRRYGRAGSSLFGIPMIKLEVSPVVKVLSIFSNDLVSIITTTPLPQP
jgi:hypothetical protein